MQDFGLGIEKKNPYSKILSFRKLMLMNKAGH